MKTIPEASPNNRVPVRDSGQTMLEYAIIVVFVVIVMIIGFRLVKAIVHRSVQRASTSVEVDEAISELGPSKIVFDAPSEIIGFKPTLVELLLSPSMSFDQLRASLAESTGVDTARVVFSNSMEAILTGPGFRIAPGQESIQAIRSDMATRWEWTVTPSDTGRLRIKLTLYALIYVDSFQKKAGKVTPCPLKSLEQWIEVKVTPPTLLQRVLRFVKANWQWLWTVLVAPVAALIWARWRRRRDQKRQSTAKPG